MALEAVDSCPDGIPHSFVQHALEQQEERVMRCLCSCGMVLMGRPSYTVLVARNHVHAEGWMLHRSMRWNDPRVIRLIRPYDADRLRGLRLNSALGDQIYWLSDPDDAYGVIECALRLAVRDAHGTVAIQYPHDADNEWRPRPTVLHAAPAYAAESRIHLQRSSERFRRSDPILYERWSAQQTADQIRAAQSFIEDVEAEPGSDAFCWSPREGDDEIAAWQEVLKGGGRKRKC